VSFIGAPGGRSSVKVIHTTNFTYKIRFAVALRLIENKRLKIVIRKLDHRIINVAMILVRLVNLDADYGRCIIDMPATQ